MNKKIINNHLNKEYKQYVKSKTKKIKTKTKRELEKEKLDDLIKNNPSFRTIVGTNIISYSGCPTLKNYVEDPVSLYFSTEFGGAVIFHSKRKIIAFKYNIGVWGGVILRTITLGEALRTIAESKTNKFVDDGLIEQIEARALFESI